MLFPMPHVSHAPTELPTILADEIVDDVGMRLWIGGEKHMCHTLYMTLLLREDRE